MKLAPVAEQIIHAYDKDQAIADIQPLDVFLSKVGRASAIPIRAARKLSRDWRCCWRRSESSA